MSCRDCAKAVSDALIHEEWRPTYVRISSGNVGLLGCPPHLKELLDRLQTGSTREEGRPKAFGDYEQDTIDLMAAMVKTGGVFPPELERMAVAKMLRGQAEHGPGTWRTVNLFDFLLEECLDIRNYSAMLVELGFATPGEANVLIEEAGSLAAEVLELKKRWEGLGDAKS